MDTNRAGKATVVEYADSLSKKISNQTFQHCMVHND